MLEHLQRECSADKLPETVFKCFLEQSLLLRRRRGASVKRLRSAQELNASVRTCRPREELLQWSCGRRREDDAASLLVPEPV